MDQALDMASVKRRYMLEIELYERTYEKWHKRGKTVVKRYRDERSEAEQSGSESRYNVLWSNVQTVLPAVFARLPKPEVTRRFKDKDPIGRVASLILERALQYEIEQYPDYASAVQSSVEDRLLPGRGISWVRYEPKMKSVDLPEVQVTDDAEAETSAEVIDYECSPVDYVNWEDFGHNVARTWEEVHIVWRKVPLTRAELIKRFGEEIGKEIALDQKSNLEDEALATPEGESLKKAIVYEIWDKKEGRAVWLCKSYEKALDLKADPLKLEGFFPCPKPLYATTTTDSLVPVPDYAQYQDQAKELDLICERINGLVDGLKLMGVYDATNEGLERLFKEAGNMQLIPVKNWTTFSEKGGLKGAIDWVPLDQVATALRELYIARDQIKAVIYEVTGIADIIRGSSDPNETLGAQKLKGQFASMRLKKMQGNVAEFATALLRIKAQIICQHYQPDTIMMMAGVEQMPEADRQFVEPAIQLLRDNPMRGFRIEISSDSLLEVDEQQEKQDRMEFLQAVGGFIREAVQAPPELAPLLGELLLFGIRGFKAGKSLEGVFDETMEQLKQKAAQPKETPPDPAMEKVKMQAQAEQVKQQMEQQRMQAEQEREAMRMQMQSQLEQQRQAMEQQMEAQRQAMEEQAKAREVAMDMQFQRWKAELDAAVKIEVANISAKVKMDTAATQAATAEISSEVKQ